MSAIRLAEPDQAPYWFLFARRGPWWLDWQVWLVLGVGCAVAAAVSFHVPLTVEEAASGRMAWEMLGHDDWIVPRMQGVTETTAFPFQSWMIALLAMMQGDIDATTIRMPGLIGILLTTMIVYGYARQTLSPLGASAASLAFLTMGGTLWMFRSGAPEVLGSCLLASSVLVWHWAWIEDWPDFALWGFPYLLLAAATLTLGLSAPLLFVGSVGTFLVLRRKEEYALSLGHLCALLLGAGLVVAWHLEFSQRTSPSAAWDLWLGRTLSVASADHPIVRFLVHLGLFPLQAFFMAWGPWSLLLFAYTYPNFRRHLGDARSCVHFLSCVVGLAWLLTWIPLGVRMAHLLPAGPCVALLVGVVVQRSVDPLPTYDWQRLWPWFVRFVTLGATLVCLVLAMLKAILPEELPEVRGDLCLMMGLLLGLLLIFTWRRLHRHPQEGLWSAGLVAVAILLLAGTLTRLVEHRSIALGERVESLMTRLPSNASIVSFGPLESRVLFAMRRPVTETTWPSALHADVAEGEYFCATARADEWPQLPFAWRAIGETPIETKRPLRTVIAAELNSLMATPGSGSSSSPPGSPIVFRIGQRLAPSKPVPTPGGAGQ